jgi:hypothetical protein
MGVFVFKDGDFQEIKTSHKLDVKIKPPETGSNVKPALAKSVDVKIDNSDADFDFFNNLSNHGMEKARSLLQAIPPEIESGDRLIIRCPNCDHKVYVQRNGDEVRINCGGCQLDVVAHIATVKTLKIEKICDTTRISKSHILGGN